MIQRHIFDTAFNPEFGRQMRFVAGPRQTGKTTLAKKQLQQQNCEPCYFNWDLRSIRSRYRENPLFYWEACYCLGSREKYWVCFDEIHKMPKWKNILKGAFDAKEKEIQFIVTGSARLDWFRKSGDSLVGRYFLFHLLPVSLRELRGSPSPDIAPQEATTFIEKQLSSNPQNNSQLLEALLKFSGFPEPLTAQSETFHQKWQEIYTDQLVREDLRDITRIRELENIAMLSQVLPQRIGSPLSLNALREDLEVSYNAVKNYTQALELSYVIFSVPPFTQKIVRSVKKERKVYFYDWTRVPEPSIRFENYVAVELQTLVSLWNDRGQGPFFLNYIRNKEGKETDFLITHNQKPWLLAEAKMAPTPIEAHHRAHAQQLGNIPLVEIVAEKNTASKLDKNTWVISASHLFC